MKQLRMFIYLLRWLLVAPTVGLFPMSSSLAEDINLEFYRAAYDGNLAEVRRFVEGGLDVRSGNGVKALTVAIQNGHEGVVQYLLSRNVPMDVSNIEFNRPLIAPICRAVTSDRLDLVRDFVTNRGADPNTDCDGMSLVHSVDFVIALKQEYPGRNIAKYRDAVRFLLERGADPNIRMTYEGDSPLQTAEDFAREPDPELIDMLLKVGAKHTIIESVPKPKDER